MSQPPIRWGILGAGKIAHKFAEGLKQLPDARLHAVASRDSDKARAFAAQHGAARAYDRYEDLAADPELDIVYIATPNNFHLAHTLLCLSEGRHVLCEKPFALSVAEAEQMFALASEKGLFLMEAMWTRFLPVWVQVRQWLAEGLIGEVRMLTADFCFRSGTWDPADRKFNPDLAGGALLDIGVYPIALACMVFGEAPDQIASTAALGSTGVDEQSAYVFRYAGGQMAVLSASFQVDGPREATLCGTKGSIRVPLFWRGQEAVLTLEGQAPQQHAFPFEATGLQWEAAAAMDCLRQGLREHPWMPASETLRVLGLMDSLRAMWGLRYPGE